MPAALERLDAGQDRVAALRVDADRRLVEDQQARPVEQADARCSGGASSRPE